MLHEFSFNKRLLYLHGVGIGVVDVRLALFEQLLAVAEDRLEVVRGPGEVVVFDLEFFTPSIIIIEPRKPLVEEPQLHWLLYSWPRNSNGLVEYKSRS